MHVSPHELFPPPLPSTLRKTAAQQKSTWDMAVNEPGRAREDDCSVGQAQPSSSRQFIKRPLASVALCLDWKAPVGQRVNLLLKSTDKHCSPSGRHHMKKTEVIRPANYLWLSSSAWLLPLFPVEMEVQQSPTLTHSLQLRLMLNVLVFCIPITAKAVVLLRESRCVDGQTADKEAN